MTSAEQRAKGIVDSSLATAGGNPKFRADLVSAITTAILEAENAKLEEAAAMSAGAVLRAYDEGFERGDLASVAANSIRSLISKKEPVDLVKIGTAALERGLNSKPKG